MRALSHLHSPLRGLMHMLSSFVSPSGSTIAPPYRHPMNVYSLHVRTERIDVDDTRIFHCAQSDPTGDRIF